MKPQKGAMISLGMLQYLFNDVKTFWTISATHVQPWVSEPEDTETDYFDL